MLTPDQTVPVTLHLPLGAFRFFEQLGHNLRRAEYEGFGAKPPEAVRGEGVRHLLDSLLARLDDGVRRPGSWEREPVAQLLAPHLEDVLEVDDSEPDITWRERPRADRPSGCTSCTVDLDSREAEGGLCWVCANNQWVAGLCRARDGRAPQSILDPEVVVPDDDPPAPTAGWPSWLIETNVRHTQAWLRAFRPGCSEEHRPCVAGEGGGCARTPVQEVEPGEGLAPVCHDQEFFCGACQRWRCFCRGGYDSGPDLCTHLCDQCRDEYFYLWRDGEASTGGRGAAHLLKLLDRRVDALLPASVEDLVPRAFEWLVRTARWVEGERTIGKDGRAVRGSKRSLTPAELRRLARLAWRALGRATRRQRFGLVLMAWADESGVAANSFTRWATLRQLHAVLEILSGPPLDERPSVQRAMWSFASCLYAGEDLLEAASEVPAFAWLKGAP